MGQYIHLHQLLNEVSMFGFGMKNKVRVVNKRQLSCILANHACHTINHLILEIINSGRKGTNYIVVRK